MQNFGAQIDCPKRFYYVLPIRMILLKKKKNNVSVFVLRRHGKIVLFFRPSDASDVKLLTFNHSCPRSVYDRISPVITKPYK